MIPLILHLFDQITSLILDFCPLVGTYKGIKEAITGVEMITREPLNPFERVMSAVGAIPFAGAFAKGFARTAITAERISLVSKRVAQFDTVYTSASSGIGIYNTYCEIKKKIVIAFREAENDFCDAIDYVNYDDGLIATSARSVGDIGCTLISPAVEAVKTVAKIPAYGVGTVMGKNKDQMDDYAQRVNDAIDGVINKFMDNIEKNNFNVVFIGYFGSALSHAINHGCYNHLSKEGLERVQGINNEAARRYKNKSSQNNQNQNYDNLDDKLNDMNKRNRERYREHKAVEDAINKAIKEDQKKNQSQRNNNANGNNNSIFPDWLKYFMDPLSAYFLGMLSNLWWRLKYNFMNYWDKRFGQGNFGTHTCPYGCGRPIPNSFYGCAELLAVFPDYFNK